MEFPRPDYSQAWTRDSISAGPLPNILPACCLPPLPASALARHEAHVLYRHLVLCGVLNLHSVLPGEYGHADLPVHSWPVCQIGSAYLKWDDLLDL